MEPFCCPLTAEPHIRLGPQECRLVRSGIRVDSCKNDDDKGSRERRVEREKDSGRKGGGKDGGGERGKRNTLLERRKGKERETEGGGGGERNYLILLNAQDERVAGVDPLKNIMDIMIITMDNKAFPR